MADTPQPAAIAIAAPTPRPSRDLVMVALAAIVPSSLILGAVRYDGGRDQRAANLEDRVLKLERRGDTVEEINIRLARIEGRLGIAASRQAAD